MTENLLQNESFLGHVFDALSEAEINILSILLFYLHTSYTFNIKYDVTNIITPSYKNVMEYSGRNIIYSLYFVICRGTQKVQMCIEEK